jgi:hypothetical protein
MDIARIERRERILEDDLHLAAQAIAVTAPEREDVLPSKLHVPLWAR